MKKCSKCGTELTLENTYESSFRAGSNICKECLKEYVKEWAKKNREKKRKHWKKWYSRNIEYMRNYMREYQRNYYIDHRRTKKKRPYPNSCEMCGEQRKLVYHHWDDKHPEVGIWVCLYCHVIAETTDALVLENLASKYNTLKEKLEKAYIQNRY